MITNADIKAAEKALAIKLTEKSMERYAQKLGNQNMGGLISKIKNKLNKDSHRLARAIHKTMDKVGGAIMGIVISMIAGPAVGLMVAQALGSVASKYMGKKAQESAINKLIAKAQQKAEKETKGKLLPLGVSYADAKLIGEGKVPSSLGKEKTWHAIEQAKLIANKKIMPLDAYIAHFHTYAHDAPPITYIPPKILDYIERLKYARGILENDEKIPDDFAAEMRENPVYKKYKPTGIDIFEKQTPIAQKIAAEYSGPNMASKMAKRRRDMVKAKNANMTYEQYMQFKRLSDIQIKRQQKMMAINSLIMRLQNITEYFPGEKFTGQAIATVTKPAETKQIAVKEIKSDDVTAKTVELAKQELQKQGINVESPEAKQLLEIGIKKLQQDLADAVAKGNRVAMIPYTAEPDIKVVDTEEGKAVAVKKETNIGALLIPAAALLLAMKGG